MTPEQLKEYFETDTITPRVPETCTEVNTIDDIWTSVNWKDYHFLAANYSAGSICYNLIHPVSTERAEFLWLYLPASTSKLLKNDLPHITTIYRSTSFVYSKLAEHYSNVESVCFLLNRTDWEVLFDPAGKNNRLFSPVERSFKELCRQLHERVLTYFML